MITIKDVAQRAQVSLGTVSNVINGKPVRRDLEEKVEEAIAELGYVPHQAARQLKTNTMHLFGVVLPYRGASYRYLLESIENYAGESGYSLLVQVSGNNDFEEIKILEQFMQRNVDGIIAVPCLAEPQKYNEIMENNIPLVFVNRMPSGIYGASFIRTDNGPAIIKALDVLIQNGHKHIALIAEHGEASPFHNDRTTDNPVQVFSSQLRQSGLPDNYIRLINGYKECALSATFELLDLEPQISAFITTGSDLAEGIAEAALMNGRNIPNDVEIATYSDQVWMKLAELPFIRIEQPAHDLGKLAVKTLLDQINSPSLFEQVDKKIETALKHPNQSLFESTIINEKIRKGTSIRFLMLASPAANATRLMLPYFYQQQGFRVELEMLTYDELYNEELKILQNKSSNCDGLMVDLTWMPQFAATGSLFPLDTMFCDDGWGNDFIEGIRACFGEIDGRQYGVPFMPGTQLLFYRKDLFENSFLKRSFFRENKYELKPPVTWMEFNTTARFFTRSLNPHSPVDYGITIGAKLDSQIVVDFCARKWAYNGRAFGSRHAVTIGSSETVAALKNYCHSFEFAPPWYAENGWDEEVADFSGGRAAMMILYDSHASRLSNKNESCSSSTGFAAVPGGIPTLGGWALSANKNSRNPEELISFIKWICSPENAAVYSILGGTTARKSFYHASELLHLYPWLPVALQSYRTSRRRALSGEGKMLVNEREYETILAGEIRNALSKQISAETAVQNMKQRLEELVGRQK